MSTMLNLLNVQFCKLYYENQHHEKLPKEPESPTVHTIRIDPHALALFHPLYPDEAQITRAKRLGILDEWVPHLLVYMHGTRCLHYQGTKALEIWNEYKEMINAQKINTRVEG